MFLIRRNSSLHKKKSSMWVSTSPWTLSNPPKHISRPYKTFPDRDITGIRSWFSLINQVSYAFSQTETMSPFRNLLKPSTEFCWTQELTDTFESSKEVIIKSVEEGMRTFDMARVTCLATDWSQFGIEICLLQKKCNCSDLTPTCCMQLQCWVVLRT